MNLPVPRRWSTQRWRGDPAPDFWDPFAEFTQLWDRMGRLFEQTGDAGLTGWTPVVETEESDEAYLVRAELPGMKREDVNVELRGNELHVTGEVNEEGGGKSTLRRRQGRFAYRASLPGDADLDKVDAQLADGVLTVRMPKTAQGQSRRIQIRG